MCYTRLAENTGHKNLLSVHYCTTLAFIDYRNKKASIRWQDSAPPISGYWPTS